MRLCKGHGKEKKERRKRTGKGTLKKDNNGTDAPRVRERKVFWRNRFGALRGPGKQGWGSAGAP